MTQVLVPPNFGTSHIVLSDWALFQYKQSTYYDPTQTKLRQFTHKYDDSRFKIWWPIKEPILSQRDEQANTSLIAKSS
jgi:dTDP-4-dehydrorhamnose 3,5-epimerase